VTGLYSTMTWKLIHALLPNSVYTWTIAIHVYLHNYRKITYHIYFMSFTHTKFTAWSPLDMICIHTCRQQKCTKIRHIRKIICQRTCIYEHKFVCTVYRNIEIKETFFYYTPIRYFLHSILVVADLLQSYTKSATTNTKQTQYLLHWTIRDLVYTESSSL
jgi:hypothetical protein